MTFRVFSLAQGATAGQCGAAIVKPGSMIRGAHALNHWALLPPYWIEKPELLSRSWDITVLLTFHLLTNHPSLLSLVAKEVRTSFQCFPGKAPLAYWRTNGLALINQTQAHISALPLQPCEQGPVISPLGALLSYLENSNVIPS